MTTTLTAGRVSKEFVLAGNAIFTIEVGQLTKTLKEHAPHYTYRVQKVEASERFPESYFVQSLTGPQNTSDYVYLGKLNPTTGLVQLTAKSSFPETSFRVRLLRRVLACVWAGDHDAYEKHGFKTHHEGRCGRCGRTLTTPESIESGIGPICAGKMERGL